MVFPVPARPTVFPARRWATRRPATLMSAYTNQQSLPLQQTGQDIVDSDGIATIAMGPSGVGAKWYPQLAGISTHSGGPATGCFCGIYAGVVSAGTILTGDLFIGGGDSAGLAIPVMTPGDLLVFKWVGATPHDIAQVTLTGQQSVLT